MSSKYTQQISPKQCVGDSLVIINDNFARLDEGLNDVRDLRTDSSTGCKTLKTINEKGAFVDTLICSNVGQHQSLFDSTKNTTTELITSSNGHGIQTTVFSYTSSVSSEVKPIGFFSAVAPTGQFPCLTLFWTASGSSDLTVYATNSSSSFNDQGSWSPNSTVNCLHLSGDTLFIGGEFDLFGNTLSNKAAIVNLSSGPANSSFGPVGTLLTSPLTANGGFGEFGSVNAIAEKEQLLIIAGSFKNTSYGNGLAILDRLNQIVYPFYVNGTVNTLALSGNDLYIGGNFDFINYGTISSTINFSVNRYETNGLCKMSMGHIENGFPNTSIDDDFCQNVKSLFYREADISAITFKENVVYVGGKFVVKSKEIVIAQNLFAMSNEALSATSEWFPVLDSDVRDIKLQGTSMYVCGDFSSYRTTEQIYLNQQPSYNSQDFSYCIKFDVSIAAEPALVEAWKPKFNNSVTTMLVGANHVYCYGQFTKANDSSVSYLAAINKSNGATANWDAYLQAPPNANNKALALYKNSIIVGGSFIKINDSHRKYLARIQSLEDNASPSFLSVAFDFGGQTQGTGSNLLLDPQNTSVVRQTTKVLSHGKINSTTFPLLINGFKNTQPGQLCNFFIRRPGSFESTETLPSTDDIFKGPIKIIGWFVNFYNSQDK